MSTPKRKSDTVMVTYPSHAIVPERDVNKRPVLECSHLGIEFGGLHAVDDFNLTIGRTEIAGLIGPNGAGKTSTLMAISNLIEGKKKGNITFEGKNISNMESSSIVKLGISHVPEGRRIFPRLTVEENLKMGTFGAPKYDKVRSAQLMEEVYNMFPRLKERRTQLGGTLSGGEQQMLAIGRGLMFSPKLLMLDEPSLGLAPLVVKEIFELILDIREKGTTVLLIEQNAGLALQIADRGYVLENGQIVMSGTGDELAHDERIIKAYLGM